MRTDADELVIDSHGEGDTRALAAAFAEVAAPGDVVGLEGPVGAGKTVFVRALCEALAVPREAGVSSPTYALVHTYDGGRLPVAHLDLYRLGDEDELEALGFRDLLETDRLVLVEWPEQAPSLREVAAWWLSFEDRGPEARRVRISAASRQALQALEAALGPRGLAPTRP